MLGLPSHFYCFNFDYSSPETGRGSNGREREVAAKPAIVTFKIKYDKLQTKGTKGSRGYVPPSPILDGLEESKRRRGRDARQTIPPHRLALGGIDADMIAGGAFSRRIVRGRCSWRSWCIADATWQEGHTFPTKHWSLSPQSAQMMDF